MKQAEANNRRSEDEHDLAGFSHGNELPELLTLINDEIHAGLRVQQDDSPSVTKSDTQKSIGRHICIELAGKQIAIPLTSILEAGTLQILQPLPFLPSWLIGITNIRGEIMSVVDLSSFLDSNESLHEAGQSYLLVHNDTIKLVITIDRIVGTRSLYSLAAEVPKAGTNEMMISDYFSEQAVYEEQDTVKELSIFDLNAFLSSDKLQSFATI
ncbi:MAG TPA: chemotaxis protein CheW [Desulfobacterales bacterium]|nr:chemotaxis protein CheW [Desulfobacterales bacterium]